MKKKFPYLFCIILLAAAQLQAQQLLPVSVDGDIHAQETSDTSPLCLEDLPRLPETAADMDNQIIDAIAPEPTRNIFFIHGLGGDRSSWSRVSAFINRTYRARSYLASYTEMGNAQECGNDLYTNTIQLINQANAQPPLLIPRERSMLIAHSQGGIVSRAMDTYEPPGEFGGIATFGTPHTGAYIINNKQDAYQLLSRTTTGLSQGPITEGLSTAIPNGWFFNTIFGNRVVNSMQDVVNVIQHFGTSILPGFIEAFDLTNVPLSEEFRVGSPALPQLKGNPHTAKVAFFGTEEDPVLWRELYNFKGKKPNDFLLWDANDDSPYVAGANNTLSNYRSKRDYYLHLAQNTSSFWNPAKRARFMMISNAYGRGTATLMTLNDEFKAVIGAVRKVNSGRTICRCEEKDAGTYGYTVNGPCPNSPPQGVVCAPIPVESLLTEDSDGAVVQSSASAYPDAVAQVKMAGSNHQQMRNDSNTKWAIRRLLNGDFHDFFKTATY